MWFIVVDARSMWPEVMPMETTTSIKTIQALRTIFARWGLPEQIVSDNGPQFTSTELQKFCRVNGVKHILVAPYHPRSNGEAECFVKPFKHALKTSKEEDILKRLEQFLFSYRTTPHSTTGCSPAQLPVGRQLRGRLGLLHPKLEETLERAQQTQKSYFDGRSKERVFDLGQTVAKFSEEREMVTRDYCGEDWTSFLPSGSTRAIVEATLGSNFKKGTAESSGRGCS